MTEASAVPSRDELRQAAADLASMFKVFPLAAGQTVPLPRSHGYLDAVADPGAIWKGWAKPWNIGYVPGTDILGLDIDRHRGDGFASLAAMEADLGPLPVTWAVITPHHGEHRLYGWPGHGITKADGYRPDVDVKGSGGYFVAPPSYRAETGVCYRWATGRSPSDILLADLPAAWRQKLSSDLLRPSAQAAPGGVPMAVSGHGDSPAPLQSAIDALNCIPAASLSYDEWFRVLCSCKAGWGNDIYPAVQDWSRNDSRYRDSDWPRKWNSCRRASSAGRSVTGGTLFHIAAQYGWKKRQWYDFSSAPFPAPGPETAAGGGGGSPEPVTPDAEPESGPPQLPQLVPLENTPLAEARLFAANYHDRVCYCSSTGWLVYDGTKWLGNEELAGSTLQDMIWAQRDFAIQLCGQTAGQLAAAKAVHADGESKESEKAVDEAKAKKGKADAYLAFILRKCMGFGVLDNLLKLSRFSCAIPDSLIDNDGNLLVTPAGTVELSTGTMRPNSPSDYATHCTAVAPDPSGSDTWNRFLLQVFDGSTQMINYMQCVCGMIAIGHVYEEKLIICVGSGGNGKSTFWGVVSRVLGDYAGTIPADAMTTGFRDNSQYVLASLRGKRLIIASELGLHRYLDAGFVKVLSSQDTIRGRQIRHEGFEFKPSHTPVLCTNELPEVQSGPEDRGIWDRIKVIPFKTRFRGERGEIKDYASQLFVECGGAVLQWILDGAVIFTESDHKLPPCSVVAMATSKYEADNDTVAQFLSEECVVRENAVVRSSDLYDAYQKYCNTQQKSCMRTSDFKAAVIAHGVQHRRSRSCNCYVGIQLDDEEEEDPVPCSAGSTELPF